MKNGIFIVNGKLLGGPFRLTESLDMSLIVGSTFPVRINTSHSTWTLVSRDEHPRYTSFHISE
jgi:hypothetical protein